MQMPAVLGCIWFPRRPTEGVAVGYTASAASYFLPMIRHNFLNDYSLPEFYQQNWIEGRKGS